MKSIVVYFDGFWSRCPYFTSNTRLLGGYGCRHKGVELGDDDERGAARGCCSACYCPIASSVYREDADDPDVDPNGFDLSLSPEHGHDHDLIRVYNDPNDEGYQLALRFGSIGVKI